jgi:arylsulfatase A-like enzyme
VRGRLAPSRHLLGRDFLLALALSTGLCAPAFSEPARKPNILVILSDDQGRGDYSAFGTRDIRTPNIDRIFREGMTFDNFYANCCVCSPTRAALLTGCYPDRVGVPGVIREEDPKNSWGWLSPDATLLPGVLKPAGYHTALIGKWHLGLSSPNTPPERGFDRFEGFLGDMMDDYRTHLRHGLNLMRRDRTAIEPDGHATDLFTDWAVAYLEERSKAKTPFFLLLAYNAPHDPLQPPPEWLEKVRAREPGLPEKRARLVALIEHMDHGIGQVLEALERTGLSKDTLVIFTSDNGGVSEFGANNGTWRGGKQHMYEGGLRVPGAARWPGRIAPGSRTTRPTLTMDIFATSCAVAGVKQPTNIDAVSFLPTLLGELEEVAQRDLYFVRREGGLSYGGRTIEALRRGRWKLVHDSPFAPATLYDLDSDPRETTDVAAKERKVFADLSAALQARIQLGGRAPWQPPAR